VLAFGLLALVAELVGRSLTHRIDIGRHVDAPGYADAGYYPALLASVKLAIALLLARLAWRVVRARAAELAARRLLERAGAPRRRCAPRVSVRISPGLWLAFFSTTSLMYLVQTHAEQAAEGSWRLVAPWLHSSALPVFAVLSVLLALVWGAVQRWLADYERYAEDTVAEARLAAAAALEPRSFPPQVVGTPPRRLFGLSFESRPPPLPA
jgi:hypothetical protein